MDYDRTSIRKVAHVHRACLGKSGTTDGSSRPSPLPDLIFIGVLLYVLLVLVSGCPTYRLVLIEVSLTRLV
jgi:hypothetical protein